MNSKSLFNDRFTLYNNLKRLDCEQFKIFYSTFVHYFVKHQCFISTRNFHTLWHLLNQMCKTLDESFPDPCSEQEKLRYFCLVRPYYFIDLIPIDPIAVLFSKFVDNRIDILSNFARELYQTDIQTAYMYINDALNLNESVDTLIFETQEHIKYFS